MIWLQIVFTIMLGIGLFVGITIRRIKGRGPAHKFRTEHRNAGERAWEDPSQIPAPAYGVVVKLLSFVLGFVGIIGFGLGFYISAQPATTEDILIPEVTEELLETETPIPEQTLTATITPTLFVEIEASHTPTPTDDLTTTPYPTYTALPTYTPYPTLESVVIERVIIVTPINHQPTAQVYYPQAQQSSYGRLVPDQPIQQQQVYQQPPQYAYPAYIPPTAQFIIPPWESYITQTPRATQTPLPTLGACPAYVETMFMTPTPSATWCYTTTPTPTERVIIITNTPLPTATMTLTPVPTQTPYIVVVTAIPTITPEPTSTDIPTETPMPTFTPSPTTTQTPLPTATHVPTETPMPTFTLAPTTTQTPLPTATDIPTETPMPTPEPTATDVPTETPIPTFTPEPTATQQPDPTPDEESTHEPENDN